MSMKWFITTDVRHLIARVSSNNLETVELLQHNNASLITMQSKGSNLEKCSERVEEDGQDDHEHHPQNCGDEYEEVESDWKELLPERDQQAVRIVRKASRDECVADVANVLLMFAEFKSSLTFNSNSTARDAHRQNFHYLVIRVQAV